MTYTLLPFRAYHLEEMQDLDPGLIIDAWLQPATLREMENHSSYTLLHNLLPVGCAGIMQLWHGRYVGWAFFTSDAGPHMLAATRKARQFLAKTTARRIEITVDARFAQGLKWARALGFREETPLLRAYSPEGRDHVGFVRLAEWLP